MQHFLSVGADQKNRLSKSRLRYPNFVGVVFTTSGTILDDGGHYLISFKLIGEKYRVSVSYCLRASRLIMPINV